jgi:hypothetical protein
MQTAINALTALKNQINAQADQHIATSCMIAGVAFHPATVPLTDMQGLVDQPISSNFARGSLVPDSRQPGFGPGSPAAVHRLHVGVAHFL